MLTRFFFALRSIWRIKPEASITIINNHVCLMSSRVKSPFSFFNRIYLPINHAYTEEEIKEVICHEHAHVAGKHSWDVILLELAAIFLWPSPLIYWYKKSIKEIHEFIADAAVVKTTSWITYSEFLIQQRSQAFEGFLASKFISSVFKNRIWMMTKPMSPGQNGLKFLGLVPLTLLLFGLISCQANVDESQLPYVSNRSIEKVDTIHINSKHQYFMNGYSISAEALPGAIRTSANHNLERRVILTTDHDNKIQDVTVVLDIAEKADARMILISK
jgi:biopolymer transport protein ExbD